MKTLTFLLITVLALGAVNFVGCNTKEDDDMVWEVREQTFQLLLKNACTKHNHTQPTIHHPDLDGKMCDYVFNGEKWKEIIYDKELTKWVTDIDRYIPKTEAEIQKRKEEYKQKRSDDFIFSDKWESPWGMKGMETITITPINTESDEIEVKREK